MADALTPTRVRELLKLHGLRPKRSLGQNFLVDPNTARRIVRLADVDPGDTVLEVGPGLGSLTVLLGPAARRVVAVEADDRVADALRAVVDANVDVVTADALDADLGSLLGGPARLVANLPYNVATPLLLRVLDDVPDIGAGLVMTQRELGQRWTATPGTKAYGVPTVRIALLAEAEIVGTVSSNVFLPRPDVTSVLVRFRRRPRPLAQIPDTGRFLAFLHAVFGQRRKTLRNALEAAGLDRARAGAALDAVGLDAGARPEQADPASLARLHLHIETMPCA